ncbi:adenylosuccinate lyase [Candidatus Aerophobetes bacterium]|nr:adenylosuccinate lyase [Candidatus Aerophobetes bacterium]
MIPRYSLPAMVGVWKEEEKFKIWLNIEILVCEAWAKLGKIPPGEVDTIKKKASFDIERINKIEEEVKHDVIAFLTALSEKVGPSSRYIHLGLTSSDILDTTLAVQLKRASEIIVKDMENLIQALKEKAIEYKYTIMMGRTHGVHAEPVTLGLKFALWYEEIKRSLHRIKIASEEIACGKVSGAVGTYAHLDPQVEEFVCERLGLKASPVSNQIIQRDRHCFYLAALAILASSLDKFCVEIRSLQRTEIMEVEEGFGKKQKGSSAMPHKKNPIICERICGLARVLRANLQAALENIPLWGERDISHSSCERIIFPDSTILIDYMLVKFTDVVKDIRVYPENMHKNIKLSRGVFFSQGIMLRLIEKGLSREDAYKMVQKDAMQSLERGENFKKIIKEDKDIANHLSQKQIEELFNLKYYIRYVDKIMERIGVV